MQVARRVGKKAAVSLGLLVAALIALAVVPGKAGPVAAGLLAAAAFVAWIGALLMDTAHHDRRPRGPTGPLARSPHPRKRPSLISAGKRDDPRIQPGDYFSTGRTLY